jgi:hypothetical protein
MVNSVVNNRKKIDIPSTKTKFKFKFGNQKTLQQTGNLQWISERNPSNKDPMNENTQNLKQSSIISLRLGINNNVKIPKSEIARYI